jgi:hypothetical protein
MEVKIISIVPDGLWEYADIIIAFSLIRGKVQIKLEVNCWRKNYGEKIYNCGGWNGG